MVGKTTTLRPDPREHDPQDQRHMYGKGAVKLAYTDTAWDLPLAGQAVGVKRVKRIGGFLVALSDPHLCWSVLSSEDGSSIPSSLLGNWTSLVMIETAIEAHERSKANEAKA